MGRPVPGPRTGRAGEPGALARRHTLLQGDGGGVGAEPAALGRSWEQLTGGSRRELSVASLLERKPEEEAAGRAGRGVGTEQGVLGGTCAG